MTTRQALTRLRPTTRRTGRITLNADPVLPTHRQILLIRLIEPKAIAFRLFQALRVPCLVILGRERIVIAGGAIVDVPLAVKAVGTTLLALVEDVPTLTRADR